MSVVVYDIVSITVHDDYYTVRLESDYEWRAIRFVHSAFARCLSVGERMAYEDLRDGTAMMYYGPSFSDKFTPIRTEFFKLSTKQTEQSQSDALLWKTLEDYLVYSDMGLIDFIKHASRSMLREYERGNDKSIKAFSDILAIIKLCDEHSGDVDI